MGNFAAIHQRRHGLRKVSKLSAGRQTNLLRSNLQLVAAQAQLAQAQSKVDGYVLTGGLDPVADHSGDDSLRGLTFSQQ